MTVDVDRLQPTRYLVLEVLAARYRLGEHLWTFPSHLRRHLAALERAGLVCCRSGVAPRTEQAWLTDAGKALVLSGDYEPPDVLRERDGAQAQLAAVVRAAEGWGGEHYDEILRILTRR